MVRATDIHSMTEFQRNVKAFLGMLKKSKQPVVLTVNGKAEVVVQDAEAYQAMIDELESARFASAVHEGLKASREGKVKDLDAAFGEIRGKLGL